MVFYLTVSYASLAPSFMMAAHTMKNNISWQASVHILWQFVACHLIAISVWPKICRKKTLSLFDPELRKKTGMEEEYCLDERLSQVYDTSLLTWRNANTWTSCAGIFFLNGCRKSWRCLAHEHSKSVSLRQELCLLSVMTFSQPLHQQLFLGLNTIQDKAAFQVIRPK